MRETQRQAPARHRHCGHEALKAGTYKAPHWRPLEGRVTVAGGERALGRAANRVDGKGLPHSGGVARGAGERDVAPRRGAPRDKEARRDRGHDHRQGGDRGRRRLQARGGGGTRLENREVGGRDEATGTNN